MRLLAVESCGPFAQKLSADDNYLLLLPIVKKLAQVLFDHLGDGIQTDLVQDKSWRVRYNIAEVLCDVSKSSSPEMTRLECRDASGVKGVWF